MGAITPDRFDPLKAFCNVRLQQGVPILDADMNELDDIRKFEVRAFLKWFVGDGVPDGNDGFRIDALVTPTPDDFQIRAGAQSRAPGSALRTLGRCIVDGRDVVIQSDVTFKGQPLFNAAAFGVLKVDPIPNTAVHVLVYLDVWERLVTAVEDKTLIVPPLGAESCARIKREWIVRARVGADVPAPGDGTSDFQKDHGYLALASINRRMVGGAPAPLLQSDITDIRRRGLLIPPSTLIPDALGVSASEYRRGVNRPLISLRDGINALLLGDLLGTTEQELPSLPGQGGNLMSYAFTFDQEGGTIAVWTGWTAAASDKRVVLGARLDRANPGAEFTGLTQIFDPGKQRTSPHAVVLPTGEILLVSQSFGGPPNSEDVFFRRASDLASLSGAVSAAGEQQIVTVPNITERAPYVVLAPLKGGGGYLVFFWLALGANPTWMFRRRLYDVSWAEEKAKWVDAAGVPLSTTPAASALGVVGAFHAAAGADGNVWAAFTTGASTIQPVRLTVAGDLNAGALTPVAPLAVPHAANDSPFVLIDNAGAVWVFFQSLGNGVSTGLSLQQYTSQSADPFGGLTSPPGTVAGANAPSAALDRHGGVWVFWGLSGQILSMRFSPTSGWGPVSQVTSSTSLHDTSFATTDARGTTIWLFAARREAGDQNHIVFRQLFSEI